MLGRGLYFILTALLIGGLVQAQTTETAKEMLIAKAEDEAIKAMERILSKRRGTPEEPDLLFRLAEMHLRKAKTTRYFEMQDLGKDVKAADLRSWASTQKNIKSLSAGSKKQVETAAQILTSVVQKFPKYSELDGVLFYQGFCFQTLGQVGKAEKAYTRLVRDFSKSKHRFDAWTSLGEMSYESGKFAAAKSHFENVAESQEANGAPYALYKMAWAEYNMKRSDHAFELMKRMLARKFPNPKAAGFQTSLRPEAIKDMALFFSDHRKADEVLSEFKNIVNAAELTVVVSKLSEIYSSHSRHKDTIRLVNRSLEVIQEPALAADLLLNLAKTYEITKERQELLKTLKATQPLCITGCDEAIPRYVSEQITKGWEAVKAGKGSREFVEELFLIRLGMDAQSDPKTVLAYAEFLYFVKDFKKSSFQYEIYSDLILADAKKAKDLKAPAEALYSALAAAENMTKEDEQRARQEQLVEKYLSTYSNEARSMDVVLLKATLEYKQKDYVRSEKTLKDLISRAEKAKARELRVKAEDLLMDIYNLQTNYPTLAQFARAAKDRTPDAGRKAHLDNLIQEAEFANIPLQKGVSPEEVHQIYFDYYQKHPNGKLASKAINLAVAHALKNRQVPEAAKSLSVLQQRQPQDKSLPGFQQELAVLYLDYGRPDLALENLIAARPTWKKEERATKTVALIELASLTDRQQEVLRLLDSDIQALGKSQQTEILGRLWSQAPQGSALKTDLRKRLINLGQEPYFSEIRAQELDESLKTKKASEVFAQAKQIVGNKAASPIARSKARLTQARILEQEFYSQSTKTSLDRIATVIALKTEKLAKLQEALESSARINPEVETVALVNTKLQSAYEHYISSLSNITIKDNLSTSDLGAIKSQLGELTSPIQQKLKDLRGKQMALTTDAPNWIPDLTDIKKSMPPKAFLPTPNQSSFAFKGLFSEQKLKGPIRQCLDQPDAKTCRSARAEALSKRAFEKESTFVNAVYLISAGSHETAFWILSQNLAKNPDFGPYYLLRAFAQKEKYPDQDLSKAAELQVQHPLVQAHQAANALRNQDCDSFDQFMSRENRILFPDSLVSVAECMARRGQGKQAHQLLTQASAKKSFEAELEAARIAEDYLIDFALARKHYINAKDLSSSHPEFHPWLSDKVNYLDSLLPGGKKPLNSVDGQVQPSGGRS